MNSNPDKVSMMAYIYVYNLVLLKKASVAVLKEAEHCARLSDIVYEDNCEECINEWSNDYQQTKYFDIKGAEAVATIKDKRGYIVFRGTEIDSLHDIIADCKVWKASESEGGGKVHVGFQAEVNKVEPLIRNWIKKHKSMFPNGLVICGHRFVTNISIN